MDETLNELKKGYGNINIHKEPIIDYLGMDLDYSNPGVVKISMQGLTDQVLEDIPVTKTVRTPATVDLFSVNNESKELEKEKKEKFHSVVAKLLYMAELSSASHRTKVSHSKFNRSRVGWFSGWNYYSLMDEELLRRTRFQGRSCNRSSRQQVNNCSCRKRKINYQPHQTH